MNHEQQKWNDHLVSLTANPSDEIVLFFNKEWARNHPLECPQCRRVFYGYQPQNYPFEPYRNPCNGGGIRQTCGHPLCTKGEMEEQLKKDPNYLKACADRNGAKSPEPSFGKKSILLEKFKK